MTSSVLNSQNDQIIDQDDRQNTYGCISDGFVTYPESQSQEIMASTATPERYYTKGGKTTV